jgi:hypothetical protein
MFPSRAKIRVEPENSLYTMREVANKLWTAMQSFGVQQIAVADRPGHFRENQLTTFLFINIVSD